jgi:hypothetical protein
MVWEIDCLILQCIFLFIRNAWFFQIYTTSSFWIYFLIGLFILLFKKFLRLVQWIFWLIRDTFACLQILSRTPLLYKKTA